MGDPNLFYSTLYQFLEESSQMLTLRRTRPWGRDSISTNRSPIHHGSLLCRGPIASISKSLKSHLKCKSHPFWLRSPSSTMCSWTKRSLSQAREKIERNCGQRLQLTPTLLPKTDPSNKSLITSSNVSPYALYPEDLPANHSTTQRGLSHICLLYKMAPKEIRTAKAIWEEGLDWTLSKVGYLNLPSPLECKPFSNPPYETSSGH